MDIGAKLKQARLAAKLTQEQVAEKLFVSRQTISNWENEKTYPDIISVIRLSELYAISLDRLLKEEKPMSNYLDYLAESTDTAKSREKLAKLALVLVYLGIWSAAMLTFWFIIQGSDAMGYGLLFFWILLPLTSFTIALLTGRGDYWRKRKWLAPLFMGLMHMLAEYGTFGLANMISFHKLNAPEPWLFVQGAAIAALGLAIGTGLRSRKKRQRVSPE